MNPKSSATRLSCLSLSEACLGRKRNTTNLRTRKTLPLPLCQAKLGLEKGVLWSQVQSAYCNLILTYLILTLLTALCLSIKLIMRFSQTMNLKLCLALMIFQAKIKHSFLPAHTSPSPASPIKLRIFYSFSFFSGDLKESLEYSLTEPTRQCALVKTNASQRCDKLT